MGQNSTIRKNPSREVCENTIKRILISEIEQRGQNKHFRTAADFMSYFESLYPASDALTKQVQRAVKSLNLPKDENGYFIVNKTAVQIEQEKEIRHLFELANVSTDPMEGYETVFLHADSSVRSYLLHLIERSETFKGKYLTIVESSNGLIFYTRMKDELLVLLNSLTI